MLLQTNSYIVPRDKRMEHARLLRRFRQTLLRLGCDHFEVYEQVGTNWNTGETTGRFVQIMRFRDRKHQLEVQAAERTDPTAQALVREFCELINFPYQQQQGLFAVGFYTSFLRMPPQRTTTATAVEGADAEHEHEQGAGDSDIPDVLPLQPEGHPDSQEAGADLQQVHFDQVDTGEPGGNGSEQPGEVTQPIGTDFISDPAAVTEEDPQNEPR
jgi:hypothetical protein